jgi:hypothetical protein
LKSSSLLPYSLLFNLALLGTPGSGSLLMKEDEVFDDCVASAVQVKVVAL